MPKKFDNCPDCRLPKKGNELKFRTRKYTTLAGETKFTLRTKCKACDAQDTRDRRKDPNVKRRERNAHLQSMYGLTLDDYEACVGRQNDLCKICKEPSQDRQGGNLVVDHCHITNEFRGLLCHPCNLMLGLARDNSQILRSAGDYLDEFHQKRGKVS